MMVGGICASISARYFDDFVFCLKVYKKQHGKIHKSHSIYESVIDAIVEQMLNAKQNIAIPFVTIVECA